MAIRIKTKKNPEYGMLYKKADDDSSSTLNQLINQEGFNQIIQKYPELSPYIVGIDIVEKISDNVILSTAIISNGEVKLVIPVIYSSGKIDATTFIYEPETDNMLALSKKTINALLSKNNKLGYGDSVTNKQLDTGNIRKLFIPPKNWSPKVASGSRFFIAVETNKDIKEAFLNKIANDIGFRNFFESVFGEDDLPYIDMALEKKANFIPPMVGDLNEVKGWLHKEAAIQEIAMNGIAISHGSLKPTKRLIKYTNIADVIRNKYGIVDFEQIGKRTGAFLGFKKNTFEIVPLLNLPTLDINKKNNINYEVVTCGCRDVAYDDIAVIQDNKTMVNKSIIPFTAQNFVRSAGYKNILFKKNGKPWRALDYVFGTFISKAESLKVKEDVFELETMSIGGKKKIIIEKNSDREPTIINQVLLVGDKNVGIFVVNIDYDNLITISDLTMSVKENDKLVKVAFDGSHFYLNNHSYTKKELANYLLKESFDKESIHSLIKTAANEGQVTMQAIDAKFDMLTKMIMNLTGEIKKIENKVEQKSSLEENQVPVQSNENNIDPHQQAVQEAQAIEQSQQNDAQGEAQADSIPQFDLDQQAQQIQASQNGSTNSEQTQDGGTPLSSALQDPNFVDQVQQACQQLGEDPNQVLQAAQQQNYSAEMVLKELQEAMAQAQQAQGQQAQGQQAQTQQAQGQQAQGQQAQGQLQDGMNTKMDPNVLQMLSELKNSPIMDTTLFSMVLANKNIALVIEDQLANLLNGASGLGRILFNIKLNQDRLEDSMGASKYKNMVTDLKTLFQKMTDFYIDLVSKKQQFKIEEE